MAQSVGYKLAIGADFEATFGTTPAAPNGILLPVYSQGLKSDQPLNSDNLLRNNRNAANTSRGNIDVSGPVVFPVDQIGIGYILKMILGAPTTTGAGDPYTHVYKQSGNQPSMVLEAGHTGITKYRLFNGCKVAKFSIELGGAGDVQITLDFMGQKETIGTSSFDATLTTFSTTKYSHFQATIAEGGSTIATLLKVKIEGDLQLDGDTYTLGNAGLRRGINDGILQLSGSVTALFEDSVLMDKAISDTESSIKVTLTASANRNLELFIPEIKYDRGSAPVDGPKGVQVELPFKAFYDDAADATSFKATLKNGQASYA